MRAVEFLVEDVDDGHHENIWEILSESTDLYEDSVEWDRLVDVLSRAPCVQDPSIGSYYAVMSILSIPIGPILSLKGRSTPIKLTAIMDSHYEFEVNGGIVRYPEGQTKTGDQLKSTLLFDSTADLQSTRSFLHLTLVGWRIKDDIQ